MGGKKSVLCVTAHPDDAEFQCAGTLALLARQGWEIVIATMTPGQAGSAELKPDEISAIRRHEAAAAAALVGGTYECLESEDIFIVYDKPTLTAVIDLIRRTRPDIVFTASPEDYIVDHEITSKLVRTACLAAGIPNIKTPGADTLADVPHLYYCAPIQGTDIFGGDVEQDIYVDITGSMDVKQKMLCCHKSQRDWLRTISNVDEYINMMQEFSEKYGMRINRRYAEGFRQHLGFSYPSCDMLSDALKGLVHPRKK